MFNCGCEVDAVIVNCKSNTGFLHVPEGQTPHIEQTARAFLAINEDITRIEVYVSGKIDAYILYFSALNKWAAVPPTEKFFGEIK
jgi:hypothetical protein